eukprot:Nitzschia sp. Nitz4//scaffold151_size53849//37374//38414//NITZ4_006727-RA/size53849-exonerate_est2genome-gene-0.49-mRNA-1//-1//CDS//3329537156//3957//frame0
MTKYSRDTWKKNDLRSKIESSRCDLCDKQRRPMDLSVKVSQYKTCGDVYMELSQISSDKATCSSGQQAYRTLCCPTSTSTFSTLSSTVQESVSSIPHRPTLAISTGIALILLFARRLMKRSARDGDDDSDAKPKKKKSRSVKESEEDYVVMMDEESQEKPSARRHRSPSRSKSRGRERSQSKKRSKSRTNSKGRKSPGRKRGNKVANDTKQMPLVANQPHNHRHPHDPRTRTRQMQQQQQIELYHPPSVQSMSTYQQPPYYENEYNLDDPNAMQEYYGPDYEYEQHHPPQHHHQQQLAYYEHGQQNGDQDYYHLEDESTLANDNTVAGLETTGGGGTVDAIVTQVV